MDAFESVILMLLQRDGYWTVPSFKVELTKNEKQQIGKPSSPRWEIDIVAYNGSTNHLLAVECKSYLDSLGVQFLNGQFKPVERYKLFVNKQLRNVVLKRLCLQLEELRSCRPSPTIQLCLAAAKLANKTDVTAMKEQFAANDWLLFDRDWITKRLLGAGAGGYENDVMSVVTKLLLHPKSK